MPCSGNCNQGRDCQCGDRNDGILFILIALIFISLFSISYGVFKLVNGTKGQDCAVEVQFSNGVKATYLGTSV